MLPFPVKIYPFEIFTRATPGSSLVVIYFSGFLMFKIFVFTTLMDVTFGCGAKVSASDGFRDFMRLWRLLAEDMLTPLPVCQVWSLTLIYSLDF